MKRKHQKNRFYKRTRNTHHIFGQTRFPHLRNAEWNQVEINAYKHDLMHWLFRDRTPAEIVAYLEQYFWGGQTLEQLKGKANERTN